MESDPLPWIILGISLVLLLLSSALDIVCAFINRTALRHKVEESNERALLLEQLLQGNSHLFLSLSILKYTSLLFIGAACGHLIVMSPLRWWSAAYVAMGWVVLALAQPIWRAFILQRATAYAFFLTPVLQGILLLLRPATVVISQINHWVGGDMAKIDEAATFSDEALRFLVSNNESAEEIEESEREMIVSILEMNETSARELMVPRIDMVTMNVDTPLQDALDVIINAGHSRIPVYEDNIDSVIGVLYAKDLLKCFRDNQTDIPIRELLRPAYFVPASKKADALFQEMQMQRVHIVMVVDEYGGTAGLVTVEDILEEIVGEIQDEYDVEEDDYVQIIASNTYLLNSRLDVYSLTKLLDITVDNDNADTLGGLLYTLMEHVPEQGESVEHEGWRFTVLSLDGRRIEEVRAELLTRVEEQTIKQDAQIPQRNQTTTRDSLVKIQIADS